MKAILTTILLNFFPLIIEGQKNNTNQYKVKDVDAICVAVNCGLQSTACALDVNCAKVHILHYIDIKLSYLFGENSRNGHGKSQTSRVNTGLKL